MLIYIRASKSPPQKTFKLKMATAVFSETLENLQHSTWLIPESQSYTSNSSHENLRARTANIIFVSGSLQGLIPEI
jgi:hypothetical protein